MPGAGRPIRGLHSEAYQRFLLRLRSARGQAKLTQFEVAKRLGRPQSYVSKCESLRETDFDIAIHNLLNLHSHLPHHTGWPILNPPGVELKYLADVVLLVITPNEAFLPPSCAISDEPASENQMILLGPFPFPSDTPARTAEAYHATLGRPRTVNTGTADSRTVRSATLPKTK